MSTFSYLYAQACDESGSLMPPHLLLERAARQWPDKTAVIGALEKISFLAMYHKSIALTSLLLDKKLTQSCKVILLCENNDVYHALYYGIWQTGAVIIPLNTFLVDQELSIIINDCDPAFIVCSDIFYERLKKNNIYVDRLLKAFDILNNKVTLKKNIFKYDAAAPCVILYTSGTSGIPKGVVLSGKAVMTNVVQMLSCTHYVTHNDVILSVIPFFHSFAQNSSIWSALLLGATSIMVSRLERKSLLSALQHNPSLLIGVPSFFGLLCILKNIDLSGVKLCISGGDALTDKIKKGFELIYSRKICNGYGLTEAGPFVAAYVEEYAQGQSSVGKLAHGIQGRLVDEHGHIIKSSLVGMLQIKGDNLMLGYYKAPELTAQVMHDGWLSTGDLATFDIYGYLHIIGRAKDLIISKGINIYPQEIENVLMNNPLVGNAALVGVDDDNDGQIGIAFISLTQKDQNHSLVITQLHQHCLKNLAGYKIPKRIIILESLPMNALQKIDKKLLQKNYLNNDYPL